MEDFVINILHNYYGIEKIDKETFEKWKNDKIKFCLSSKSFLPIDEANNKNSGKIKEYLSQPPNSFRHWEYYLSFEEFYNIHKNYFDQFKLNNKNSISFIYYENTN